MPSFTGTLIEDDAPQAPRPMFGGTLVEESPALVAAQPAQAQAAPSRSWGDLATDVGRSALSGLDKGVAGIAGAPADAARGISWAKDYLDARMTGQNADQLAAQRDAKAPVSRTTLENYGGDAFHQGSGLAYDPQTTAGKYADTVASFVPGALLGPGSVMRRFALGAGVPGLASEAAGQATAGSAAEPFVRAAAAIASPIAASRAITPITTSAGRIPLTNTLEAEGIPLSAGQRTGSMPLQWMESTLSDVPFAGSGAGHLMEAQKQGLNRAVARRFGEDADLLTPDVMRGAAKRIGGVFDDVQSRNSLQYDAQMGNDIANTIDRYGKKLTPLQKGMFGDLIDDVRNQTIAGGGSIPGDVYQQARSDLTKLAQGAKTTDPLYADSVKGLRNAMDSAFERSVAGTPDAGALGEARRQYAAMKTAEKAVGGAGVSAAEGNVSPNMLRSAVAGQDKAAYVRGQGDMTDLARAATAIAPLPNSGTAPRSMAQHALTVLGSAGAGAMMGVPNETALLAAAAGLGAPALAGRALMSAPMQAYLGNRLLTNRDGLLSQVARGGQGFEDSRGADPLQLRVRSR
ncbi:hypothetical protein [Methylobacterium sp. WL7]|uniref:hypothetical protein n=1 Tax=Methylobacterium sp. WL7 TaxID=2603900 RepID=UPI0011CCB051|nr:hypothetical protein [Methylobacterium sp. WL7]TXN43585.1 hypothetical protein FV233_17970 [Methylobacterium sp. WL7]